MSISLLVLPFVLGLVGGLELRELVNIPVFNLTVHVSPFGMQIDFGSGKLSWEQVLRYARLRKRYISLYAKLLKSDISRAVVDDNEELEELDRGLDIELILQWRYYFLYECNC